MADVRINDHSDEYMKDVDAALEAAMEAIGIHLEGEAKEELSNSPKRIDTGLLRNSITYAVDGKAPNQSNYSAEPSRQHPERGKIRVTSGSYSGTAPEEQGHNHSVMVGTNVSYALYVHEGHSTAGGKTVSPNRFLKNAVERNKDQIDEYIKKAMS